MKAPDDPGVRAPGGRQPRAAARMRDLCVLLFLAALLVGFYRRFVQHPGVELGNGFERLSVARSLAEEGSFANPFRPARTGYTAHLPPLYPLYLAAILKLTGDGVAFGVLATFLTILVFALHTSLLPRMSELLFGEPVSGLYAAALCILLPAFQLTFTHEAIFAATGIMLFCLYSYRRISRQPAWLAEGLRNGLKSGVLVLLNPATVAVTFAWHVFTLHERKVTWRAAAKLTLGFVTGAVLVCTPWAVRNYLRFRTLILVRSDFGLTLYTSNHNLAESSTTRNLVNGCQAATHPNQNPAEAELLRRMGEPAYHRARLHDAVQWIRTHPGRFLRLTARRVLEFWFPDPFGASPYAYAIWCITALSLLGMCDLVWRRVTGGWFLVLAVLAYSPVYYVVVSDRFYRYPVLWLSLLSAGCLIRYRIAGPIASLWRTTRPVAGGIAEARRAGPV
jgi:hypothetical protein